MKNILFMLLLIVGFWRCQHEDHFFDISVDRENFTFQPMAGGAIMRYTLPRDKDVLSIRVRYQDALGNEILRTGSYACDSLMLIGFNEARKRVPATVTVCDRNNVESEPVEVFFDTEDSGPVAFFNHLEVKPGWNGFMITYDAPKKARGIAHVFYVGKDPKTLQPDTLLLSSFAINEGSDTLAFALKQSEATNQVVIRTEDFRGYMVKQKIWEKVEAYNTEKLAPSKFKFEDPENLSRENPELKLGYEYLFDGDTKGLICLNTGEQIFNTYLAGPGAVGVPLFILDLQEPRMIASVNLYALLYVQKTFPWGDKIWRNGTLMDMLPCKVSVYVSNDKNNEASWKKMAFFEEDKDMTVVSRWCSRAYGIMYSSILNEPEEIEKAEPCCVEMNLPATGEAYRYVKVVVDELFNCYEGYPFGLNTGQYVTLHEVEIYTSKD